MIDDLVNTFINSTCTLPSVKHQQPRLCGLLTVRYTLLVIRSPLPTHKCDTCKVQNTNNPEARLQWSLSTSHRTSG